VGGHRYGVREQMSVRLEGFGVTHASTEPDASDNMGRVNDAQTYARIDRLTRQSSGDGQAQLPGVHALK
jgi:hypothetical protein